MQALGIVDRSGFHILRKSFRHRLQVAGVTVDVARRLMRHSNIRVTDEHYTIYQVSELADALNTLSPQ
jgi:integrase